MLPTSLEELRANSVTFTELEKFLEQVSNYAAGASQLIRWVAWQKSVQGSECLNRMCLMLGAFGEVRMCVHRESGAQRAVKVLRKSHMDDDEKRMLFNEINILKDIVSSVLFTFRQRFYALLLFLSLSLCFKMIYANLEIN